MRQKYKIIDKVRFALMLPVCIISFGIPLPAGTILRLLCGMASISFYIFSGFLVTRSDKPLEEKLRRAILRTACLASILLLMNLLANAVYLHLMGTSLFQVLRSVAASKRFWFEFLVMNIWHLPLGENFWFIQALLYGYIVMYLLCKCKLLKYDWVIAVLCITLTILTGELSGVVGFSFLGYRYIPANFITRALPYLLLGEILRKKRDAFLGKRGSINFVLLIAAGIVITIAEVSILSRAGKLIYTGHLIGNGIAAAGLCILVIMAEYSQFSNRKSTIPTEYLRRSTTIIYATHQLIGTAVMMLLAIFAPQYMSTAGAFMAILAFALSLLLAALLQLAWHGVRKMIKSMSIKDSSDEVITGK